MANIPEFKMKTPEFQMKVERAGGDKHVANNPEFQVENLGDPESSEASLSNSRRRLLKMRLGPEFTRVGGDQPQLLSLHWECRRVHGCAGRSREVLETLASVSSCVGQPCYNTEF